MYKIWLYLFVRSKIYFGFLNQKTIEKENKKCLVECCRICDTYFEIKSIVSSVFKHKSPFDMKVYGEEWTMIKGNYLRRIAST